MTSYRYGAITRKPELYLTDIEGAITDDVSDYIAGGSVDLNNNRAISMGFSGNSRIATAGRPFVDFLAPFLTVEYSDGFVVRNQVGLYALMPPSRVELEGSTSTAIEGRSLEWLLSVDYYDQGYSVATGVNPVEEARSIIDTVGARHSIPSTTLTLPTARSWQPATSKLAVVNDLLAAAGYYAIFAFSDGRLGSMPYRRLASAGANVRYATDGSSRAKVLRTVSMEPPKDGVYNKVIVVKDDPNQAPIIATAVNTSPASPISTTTLGYTIARPPVSNPDIINQDVADALAARLLEEATSFYTKMVMYSTPDPARGPHEIGDLAIRNKAGRVIAADSWWISGWRLPFDRGAAMQIEANKLLPFEAL